METIDKIKQQISENAILLYMKGSPKLPSCGFSSQASQALMQCGHPFAYVDILQNPDQLMDVIRQEIAEIRDNFGAPRITEIIENKIDLTLEEKKSVRKLSITMCLKGSVTIIYFLH